MARFAKTAPFGPSVFSEMTRLAAEYNAVNLGQGFPDFPGPDFVKEAAKAAIDADHNQYAISSGAPRLRRQIAKRYSRLFDREIDAGSEVTVTSGATEAVFAAMSAFVGPGQRAVAFEPFYDSYRPSVLLAGGEFQPVRLTAPDWIFDRDELDRAMTPNTSVLLLNTPHNPTGKVFSVEELEFISKLCRERDVLVVSDEVYSEIRFNSAAHVSIATLPGMWEQTLTVNSTGKTFSMTGWKIGYAIGPEPLTTALRAVHQFVTFASATPFQEAMATAMEIAETVGYYETLRFEYDVRRLLLQKVLEEIGFRVFPIAGSYFLTVDLVGTGFTSDVDFCKWLVQETGVVALPPSAFYVDPSSAPLHARFCFAKKLETLEEAGLRLQPLPRLIDSRQAI